MPQSSAEVVRKLGFEIEDVKGYWDGCGKG